MVLDRFTESEFEDPLKQEKDLIKPGRLSIKRDEVRFVTTRQARVGVLVNHVLGFPAKSLNMFIGEIPPGGHTGCHRHMCEACIYILSGKGYTMVEDKKVEWEEGDAMFMPVMAWHQHFNGDPRQPARYLAATNFSQMEKLGLSLMESREYFAQYEKPEQAGSKAK